MLTPEPSPGFFQFRATKGAPWQGVRVILRDGGWFVLVSGELAKGSGAADPLEIPFLLYRWPLTPITENHYLYLLVEHERARPGTPLWDPGEPVDFRKSAPLW